MPFWIHWSGADRVFVPFWICRSGAVSPDALSTMSGAEGSEFSVRLEIFLLIESGIELPIHLGRGCCVMAIAASFFSTVTMLIDTPISCCGRTLRAMLTCCSIGFIVIFPSSIKSWILCLRENQSFVECPAIPEWKLQRRL